MEFQILDVDYILVNEKPVIRIFGKTEKGETVCGFYDGYSPYFYAQGNVKILEKEGQVSSIENVKRKMVYGGEEQDIYKIVTKNPAKTPDIRDKLKSSGVKVYEADILFKYRFMNDLNLKSFEWIRVSDINGVGTETVSTSRRIQVKEIEKIEKKNDIDLKYLALDIECVPLKSGEVPEAKRDPIIMVSMAFSHPWRGKETVVISTRSGRNVIDLDSEKELLEEVIRVVMDYDPDIITGYNINNFDMPYILERMKKNGIKPVLGRCCQKQAIARKFAGRHRIGITGRVVVDSFDLVKKDFSLQRYGLDFVAKTLLKKNKESVKHSEIEKLWKGGSEDFRRLVSYNRTDSVLALSLARDLNLIDKYVALSKVSGTLLQDTLDSGETTRIENLFLREFNKEGYVFPSKPDSRDVAGREKSKAKELKGGYVIEPQKRLHSNIAVLDFLSMYPSIIRSFNICPTTLVRGRKDTTGLIKTPSGVYFYTKEERLGIIPRVVEELMDRRRAAKKKLKRAEGERKRILYAEQWALKIMANALYGYMGYSRARIFDLDLANAITSYGRFLLQKTKKDIEKMGYGVVYGDTDSVMVKIGGEDMEKIGETARGISVKITKTLPGIMELEFEKLFKRFLPLTKKRYVAWCFTPVEKDGKIKWEEGIEMKGVETVRRDWCGLTSETLSNVIEIILKKNDVKRSVSYFKGVIEELVQGKIPLQKLIITKTMTKPPAKYVGVQPHIEVVKKIMSRNPAEAPGIGDRIGYVILKGTDLLSKRAEDPSYIEEKGLHVDPQYYIENQLLPPLERIFSSLRISKSELLGNGKQMGLMEVIKRGNRKAAVQKEISLGSVNGFVCRGCSKFYTRVPLVGSCVCGGEMLFSSQQGSSQTAVVN